jgi:flagellar secretion chaperone FliS
MSGSMRNNHLAAYSSVATHGGIAADDPHRLILMLMDGALERIAMARGSLQRGDIAQKAALVQRIVGIVVELRASLDLEKGGALAQSLDELYGYMERQLIRANCDNKTEFLDEVGSLLGEIRSAWVAVPLAVKTQQAAAR